jgi:hypothetical protein
MVLLLSLSAYVETKQRRDLGRLLGRGAMKDKPSGDLGLPAWEGGQ